MAKLSYLEKELIEDVFQMGSGYVLDFSNREFKEFMMDVINEDIYTKYPDKSKARMLRCFLEEYSESFIGKCIILMIQYMQQRNMVNEVNKAKVNKLLDWGEQKLGRKPKVANGLSRNQASAKDIDYAHLKTKLLAIEDEATQQKKGYAFENFMKELLEAFDLSPKASFKTESDQIDGSFSLFGNTILLEAKYRTKAPSKDDLILFENKLKNRSPFVKGLFVTLAELPVPAIDYFKNHNSRIIVMTVQELYLLCERELNLSDVLMKKFRCLDERGLIYKHLNSL